MCTVLSSVCVCVSRGPSVSLMTKESLSANKFSRVLLPIHFSHDSSPSHSPPLLNPPFLCYAHGSNLNPSLLIPLHICSLECYMIFTKKNPLSPLFVFLSFSHSLLNNMLRAAISAFWNSLEALDWLLDCRSRCYYKPVKSMKHITSDIHTHDITCSDM